MIRSIQIACLALATISGTVALAANDGSDIQRYRAISDDSGIRLTGQAIRQGKARADTIYLLGGPNRDDGDFQTAAGAPSWDGWTSHDLTAITDNHWHIDNYNCANLDPATLDNHAWWCGSQDFPSCGGGDPAGGYGNLWHEYLDWTGSVADNGTGVTVTVNAVLNHDVETNWDYLYLEYITQSDNHTLAEYTGTQDSVVVSETFTLTPSDYVGAGNDEVHLRWRFQSDSNTSDEDCLFPSAGAAQIDLISVFFDQGLGPVQIGATEDCEGTPQWSVASPPGVGDFAKVWPRLQALNTFCWGDNATPQVAFIDDGVVVPGTGGYQCTTWCYGPGGYVVNPEGGLAGPDSHIHNEIWSPALAWPGAGYEGAILTFDVYRHQWPTNPYPGIYYTWRVRSTDSLDPADIEEAVWLDSGWIYYHGAMGPGYHRFEVVVTDYLVQDRQFVQLALGIFEWPGLGAYGTDSTPAPYFDNVAFVVYDFGGPAITANAIDLANDAFPQSGTIDYTDAGANSVRFDMARNISLPSHLRNDPGDSITADVTPVRTGSVLNDMPKLHYRLKPNPLFDAVRTSGLPNAGFVYGDSTRTSDGTIVPDRYMFDLPDTGFFFPGDVIHYYIEAQDNVGGDIGTSLLPGDTNGFSDFSSELLLYAEDFSVRALPTLHSLTTGDQPEILFWYDYYLRTGEDEWLFALHNLGYQEGADYDLFYPNASASGVGNGLGGRATSEQLLGYETILYMAGDLGFVTISNGDFNADAGDDVGVLDTWLRSGGKSMFLTGTHLIFDLVQSGASTQSFLSDWISVDFVATTVVPLIDGQYSPLVKAVPGNSVFTSVNEWIAFGHCRRAFTEFTFDAVVAAGTAELLAEFTDPDGNIGQYPYVAATLNHDATYDANVIFTPIDLMFTHTSPSGDKAPPTSAARTRILEDVLQYFGHTGGSLPTDMPETGVLAVKSYPNPFNPTAKIEYHMPRAGELKLRIFNVRGELVKTLIDGYVEQGSSFVLWDGTNARDEAVASGIYFYEMRALDKTIINKMALVK